jgi:transposase
LGIDNIVVNPSDVPSTFKEIKTKRDDVDSLKLAQTLRGGLLRGIYIPTEAQIELARDSHGSNFAALL